MIVTAAHCFCDKLYDVSDPKHSTYTVTPECTREDKADCVRSPKPGHYFIRIGIIDNKAPLKFVLGKRNDEVQYYQNHSLK